MGKAELLPLDDTVRLKIDTDIYYRYDFIDSLRRQLIEQAEEIKRDKAFILELQNA